jgi:branched-chain amino acid transport system permease protein
VIAAAVVGGIAALPALQLDADYFAIVTLAFSEIVRLTLNADTFAGTVADPELTGYNVVSLFGYRFGTGGGQGISTPFNNPLGFLFEGPLAPVGGAAKAAGAAIGVTGPTVEDAVYALFLLVVVVSAYYALLRRVGNSPFGRVLKAIREDELVAASLGKDTRLFKIKVFMLGCGLMGLAGVLWQGSRGFVNPNTFRPIVTFYVFTALIVGGAGSNTGSVVGGAVFAAVLFEGPKQAARLTETVLEQFVTLPDPNTFYAAAVSLNPVAWLGYAIGNIAYLKFVFLGAVLVYLMQNRPSGIMGHRKEPAASIDLTERPPRERDAGGSPDVAADGRGGGSDE